MIIIDDDTFIVDRISTLLSDVFNVKSAFTGNEGLNIFNIYAEYSPLVICDVDLPDLNGFHICKSIKSISPKTYVMLFTGYNSNDVRIKGLNSYADICLDKSISDSELKLLVRNAHNTMKPRELITSPLVEGKHPVDNKYLSFEFNVKEYILGYYRLPMADRKKKYLALDVISTHYCMDKRTFQRRIKSTTGSSYVKYMAKIKIEKSKELLTQDYNVSVIADIMEYSSPSHFSREFKKVTELTPNKYKLTIQNLL